jgi:hypothetical protein
MTFPPGQSGNPAGRFQPGRSGNPGGRSKRVIEVIERQAPPRAVFTASRQIPQTRAASPPNRYLRQQPQDRGARLSPAGERRLKLGDLSVQNDDLGP